MSHQAGCAVGVRGGSPLEGAVDEEAVAQLDCDKAPQAPRAPQASRVAAGRPEAAATAAATTAVRRPSVRAGRPAAPSSSPEAAEGTTNIISSDSGLPESRRTRHSARKCWVRIMNWLYPLACSDGKQGSTPRLEALDAPRWIGSIQIVMYHMYQNIPGFKQYAAWMAMWTQLFFLLSGFVLAYAEMARPAKKGKSLSVLQYVRRRLTVIYPAFLLSVFMKLSGCSISMRHTDFQWKVLPLQLTLTQSWLPICTMESWGPSCSPWSWNGESWFLSVLILYWVVLRPLAQFFRKRSALFCIGVILGSTLFSLVFLWAGHKNHLAVDVLGCTGRPGDADWICIMQVMVAIRAGPLGYFHVFASGVALARLFVLTAMSDAESGGPVLPDTKLLTLDADKAPFLSRYGCCLGYSGYLLLLFYFTDLIKPYYYFFHNGGLLPIMSLILMGAAVGKDPLTVWLFRCKPMLVLGRLSYAQYLMQSPLKRWFVNSFGPWDENFTVQVIYIPALIVFAYACQRWVERPYTEYQRWRQEKSIKGIDDRAIEAADRCLARACACLRRAASTLAECARPGTAQHADKRPPLPRQLSL